MLLFCCKMGLHGIRSNDFSCVCRKLGCFKRKTLEYYQEQEEEAALQDGTPSELTNAPTNGIVNVSETDGKSDQTLEEKTLLDDGSTPLADTEEELF